MAAQLKMVCTLKHPSFLLRLTDMAFPHTQLHSTLDHVSSRRQLGPLSTRQPRLPTPLPLHDSAGHSERTGRPDPEQHRQT